MIIDYPDRICDVCQKGFLRAETGKNNKVLKNTCSECDFVRIVAKQNILTKLVNLIKR